MTETERLFDQAMLKIYQTAKSELGYNANRFFQMLSDYRGVETARRLLWADQVSEGFEVLRSHGRLDLTVERHILKPEFESLFTEEDRQRARDRLEMLGG